MLCPCRLMRRLTIRELRPEKADCEGMDRAVSTEDRAPLIIDSRDLGVLEVPATAGPAATGGGP